MRHYLLILLLAAIFPCIGCQVVSNHVKQSLSSAADDYHRVTTGGSSSYIANQRAQP
jgi:hypothetical protein